MSINSISLPHYLGVSLHRRSESKACSFFSLSVRFSFISSFHSSVHSPLFMSYFSFLHSSFIVIHAFFTSNFPFSFSSLIRQFFSFYVVLFSFSLVLYSFFTPTFLFNHFHSCLRFPRYVQISFFHLFTRLRSN